MHSKEPIPSVPTRMSEHRVSKNFPRFCGLYRAVCHNKNQYKYLNNLFDVSSFESKLDFRNKNYTCVGNFEKFNKNICDMSTAGALSNFWFILQDNFSKSARLLI